MHVYRWDLDRTYLETEIHSVRGLVRAALEDAASKRTVPGAATLLKGLVEHDPESRVVILSGSPTQMRAVLEEKLHLDGIRVDRLILKDNLGNIRRGRLRAVRGQVGYKLPHLLEDRVGTSSSIRETLFGDDSEADAAIYCAYAEALEGELGRDELVRVLQEGRAYPDHIEMAVAALERVDQADAVEDIFIRVDRGVPVATFRMLGRRVIPVFSWVQAALVLHARGRLPVQGLARVADRVSARLDSRAVVGLLQDAVRRALIPQDLAHEVLEHPDMEAFAPLGHLAISSLGALSAAPRAPDRPDLIGFLRSIATT